MVSAATAHADHNMTGAATFWNTPFAFEQESLAYIPYFRNISAQYATYSYAAAALYVVVILAIKSWMEKRESYSLKGPLVLWNFIMAAFSTFGALRTVPFFVNTLATKGFTASCCDGTFFVDPVTAVWPLVFWLSKYPELIDTVFIVLRKRPLSFLHFFHHASVVVFASHSYSFFAGSGLWFMTMNYAVHSVMYSYYFLMAMGIRLPKFISMLITSSQIAQMIAACTVTAYVYYGRLKQGLPCGSDGLSNVYMAAVLYFMYLVLFVQLFVKAYVFPSKRAEKPAKKAE